MFWIARSALSRYKGTRQRLGKGSKSNYSESVIMLPILSARWELQRRNNDFDLCDQRGANLHTHSAGQTDKDLEIRTEKATKKMLKNAEKSSVFGRGRRSR